MLSRLQFQTASSAFARRHPHWRLVDGHRPGYGHLTRTTSHLCNSPKFHYDANFSAGTEDLEVEDAATAPTDDLPTLFIDQYIAYSASYNVPAFYFTAHNANGTPCSLDEILASSFFKVKPPGGSETTDYALTLPSVPFPVVSQGELDGMACWYFHPCESGAAVEEFFGEIAEKEWSEETRLVRWLELWLMIVGSILTVEDWGRGENI